MDDTLWPSELGYLRRANRGAVFTALADLHRNRLITVCRNGMRRTNRPLPPGGDPVRRTVYSALRAQTSVRSLAATTSVRRAVSELAEDLADRGLVPRPPLKFAIRLLLLLGMVAGLAGLMTGRLGLLACIAVLIGFAVCWREHNEMLEGFARRGLAGVRMSDRGFYQATDSTLSGGAEYYTP